MNNILQTSKAAITLIVLLITGLLSCKESGSKLDRKLFIGNWREVRHLENPYDEDRVIRMTINEDGTCTMNLPYRSISITGRWYLTSVDTVHMFAIRNDQEINSVKESEDLRYKTGQERYFRYYFLKINKAEKGKLYITDISINEAYEGSYEHLLMPVE